MEALELAAEKSGKGSSSGAVTRSGTALIIKNLPYSAEERELQVRRSAAAVGMIAMCLYTQAYVCIGMQPLHLSTR